MSKQRKPNTNGVVCTSEKQIQSRSFTLSRRDYTALQENLVMKIVEFAQTQIEGYHFNEIKGMAFNLWGDKILTIDLKDLTQGAMYTKYKAAAKALCQKIIEIKNPKTGREDIIPFFQRVTFVPGTTAVDVQVAKEIWDNILDFTNKAIDLYNVRIALTLPTSYAKRFYIIISQSSKPIKYSLESLNHAFDTNYTAKMFEQRILIPVKKVLDEMADWSIKFEAYYDENRQGKRGRKPILGWEITPIRIHDVEPSVEAKYKSKGPFKTGKAVRDWLVNNMDFDTRGLRGWDQVLSDSLKVLRSNWEQEFDSIKTTMDRYRGTIKERPPYFMKLLNERIKEINNPIENVKQGIIDAFRTKD